MKTAAAISNLDNPSEHFLRHHKPLHVCKGYLLLPNRDGELPAVHTCTDPSEVFENLKACAQRSPHGANDNNQAQASSCTPSTPELAAAAFYSCRSMYSSTMVVYPRMHCNSG